MEQKHNNISLSIVNVPRVPSLAVSISWNCPQSNWYTLHKLKKGYKTNDPQFKEGGQCMVLCYSLFQRIKEKKAASYNDAKYPIDCLKCNVQDGRFQICYNTANKLSYLKRTLKNIIKEMDSSRASKQYNINMHNLGGKVNKDEFRYTVSELNKSLKNELCIVAAGNIKLKSTKQGQKVSPSQNLKILAKYIADAFPKIKELSGKKNKPKHVNHTIPDIKPHYILKLKSGGITSMLVADYITKTLSIYATALNKEVIVWDKNPLAKFKKIKEKKRYEREMLSKKNINEQIVYHAIEGNCANNKNIISFYKTNPSKDKVAQMVISEL